jgi:signal transduction histidine kinase
MTSAAPSTILLAEDDELVRLIAEETLTDAGYRVVSVPDGAAALEALPRVRPDLILSDVRMPRCDGFEFLQQVRSDPANVATPFILVSAKADTADQRMGMSLGADDYVTKPFQSRDLLKTIAVRLARASLLGERVQRQQRFLARVLPHELRTPLTGIIGYAELMEHVAADGGTLTNEELADYAANLGRSGRRLLRLAEDISLWAWLEDAEAVRRNGGDPELAATAVRAALVQDWCREVAERFGRAQDLAVQAEDAAVLAAPDGFACVAGHLVENAFKFSLPGSMVRVGVRRVEGRCVIEIRDQGRGLSEDEIAQIGAMRQFGRERFEQQGLGLGLALAGCFARVAGGALRLVRNDPPPGLTTVLELPLAAAGR